MMCRNLRVMHGGKIAITSLEKFAPMLASKRVNRPSWRSHAAVSGVTLFSVTIAPAVASDNDCPQTRDASS